MSESKSESYKAAGVDVTAGYAAVRLMKSAVEATYTKGVLGSIGGFGGLFEPDLSGMKRPVFVSGTDGVGTKLKIAFLMDRHDTIGRDCVAMCVNDIACSGATPLFFLDYLAVGKLVPERVREIVSGVADGCVDAGCALIGGETAEMPGFYPENEYDLAGFSVGVVDFDSMVDGKDLREGDVLIAVASSGIHSNGYSLVRKALRIGPENVGKYIPELSKTLGEELLTPTRIYVKAIRALSSVVKIKAVSHITGGGFYENIPRMLSEGFAAHIQKKAVPVPRIFDIVQKEGDIGERDMYNTFNMGAGLIVAVAEDQADRAVLALNAAGERAYAAGRIRRGDRGVTLW